jgi:hypothetical protein
VDEWESLRQLCPLLYRNGMRFECGLGWYEILHDLSLKIERILEKDAENHPIPEGEEDEHIQIYAVQVKEKYGTLRIYMSYETDEISSLIEKTETISHWICESCGAEGRRRGITWFTTRCDKCYAEEE